MASCVMTGLWSLHLRSLHAGFWGGDRVFGAIAGSTIFLFSVDSFLYSELAPRRFGVATAQLEWWARLRANAQARRAVSKLGLGLSGVVFSA